MVNARYVDLGFGDMFMCLLKDLFISDPRLRLSFLSCVCEQEWEQRCIAFAHGDLPVRYLGLPLLTKQMTVRDYASLIEKIRARIGSWTARFLSIAGRLQLIGSVIHNLTNFWISAFKLPRKCIQEIDSHCAAFLWSGADLSTNKTKVSWKDCCRPKEEGGLGLRSLEEANQVSCLKLVWRILSSKNSFG